VAAVAAVEMMVSTVKTAVLAAAAVMVRRLQLAERLHLHQRKATTAEMLTHLRHILPAAAAVLARLVRQEVLVVQVEPVVMVYLVQ
jgi:hypothetical protein